MLPAVCKFNRKYDANRERQARVREFLIRGPVGTEVLRSRSINVEDSDLGDIMVAVVRELVMPRSLGDVGVGREYA